MNLSPLELLNLHYSDGQSTGKNNCMIWKGFNRILSWDNILHNDYQKDISPLLFYILTKYMSKNYRNKVRYRVDEEELKRNRIYPELKESYYYSLKRNLILMNELDEIIYNFESQGIRVVVLKGGYLAESIYKDISCRPMGDLDILVKKRDIEKSTDILLKLGYISNSEPNSDWHTVFYKYSMSENIILELHNRLAKSIYQTNFSLEEIFSNKLIPIEYKLAYLSWHGLEHGLKRIIWLCDLMEILKNKRNIKWDVLTEKSKKYKVKNQLYFCIYMIDLLFDKSYSSNFYNREKNRLRRFYYFNASLIFILIQMKVLKKKNEKYLRRLLYFYLMEKSKNN